MISSISLGVTINDFTGKCLRLPVTKYEKYSAFYEIIDDYLNGINWKMEFGTAKNIPIF